MERLWISNIAPGTSDAEITALVAKYAPDLHCVRVERVEGEGTRPGALLSFTPRCNMRLTQPSLNRHTVVAMLERLDNLSRRLDGMHWKGRELSSSSSVFG